MTERVRSQYTNLVKLKLDQRSLKRTRKQIQNFRSEVAKMLKLQVDVGGLGTSKRGSGSRITKPYEDKTKFQKASNTLLADQLKIEDKLAKKQEQRVQMEQNARRKQAVGGLISDGTNKASQTMFADILRSENKAKSPLHDSHVRMQRDQEKFNALQEKSIRNFMVSNRAIRQMSDEEKAVLKQKLMQAKTQEQLIYLMRKERAAISDTLAQNRRLTREVEKRNVFQQRMNSSVMQMVGTLGSAYALTAGISSSLNIGMQMESMQKSFKVVSTDSKAAAENMAWVRSEAMRLGSPIMEASKGFSSMIAAAGDKMTMDDLKATFTGIQEAGVALGLSREDLGGTILAVKQMLSRLLGRVNFLNSGNILTF